MRPNQSDDEEIQMVEGDTAKSVSKIVLPEPSTIDYDSDLDYEDAGCWDNVTRQMQNG